MKVLIYKDLNKGSLSFGDVYYNPIDLDLFYGFANSSIESYCAKRSVEGCYLPCTDEFSDTLTFVCTMEV